MKKREEIIKGLVFLSALLLSVNVQIVNATAGKLRSRSIITCNGIMYGKHGDGHWHQAVKHKSGYYPVGSPVTPPCLNTNNSNKNNNSNNSNKNSNSSASVNKKTEKRANLDIENIRINDEKIDTIKNTMTYTTYAENIDLEVIPEDLEATVKITGSLDNLEVNKPRKINISITHLTKSKNYTLNVIRKVNLDTAKISLNNKELDLKSEDLNITVKDKKLNFNLENTKDMSLKIYKNDNEIVGNSDAIEEDTTYKLVLNTTDNQTKSFNLKVNYIEDNTKKITDSSKIDNNNSEKEKTNSKEGLGITITTILAITFIYCYLVKNKK